MLNILEHTILKFIDIWFVMYTTVNCRFRGPVARSQRYHGNRFVPH